jgi:hypothetical protein
MAAEHVLDAGARDGEPDAYGDQVLRDEPEALLEVGAALLELSRCAGGLGAGQQELDPLFGRRAVGQ